MKKNTASQRIGAQMVNATTGAAFTGAVTVYVTIDAGTQAIGSVGSGACTHEGNGFHTYAPAQAETNGDHLAFTFIGTGAVPATVQVFTNFPQTGDGFVRLGAPVGASISADVAAVQADTDNLQTRIPAALVSGRIDASVGAMATDVLTSAALAASAVTEIQAGLATPTNITAATGVTVAAIGANVITATAIAADAITDAKVAADVTIASVTGAVGSVTAAVATTSNIKKNAALAKFAFVMTDSTTHAPATGKTVTCTRSIDGAAFGAGTLASVTEVANGVYTVDFGAGDLNGNVIVLRCTAAACDDTLERIVTQP